MGIYHRLRPDRSQQIKEEDEKEESHGNFKETVQLYECGSSRKHFILQDAELSVVIVVVKSTITQLSELHQRSSLPQTQ